MIRLLRPPRARAARIGGALLAFSRPHTIIGTTVSVVALYVLALLEAAPNQGSLSLLALAVTGSLATNIYIVGLNQLADVDIDRINKPWLPLASGALSIRSGRAIVSVAAVLAVVAGLFSGPFMTAAFAAGLLIGTAYSVPPLHLKRSHVWAAAAIAVVRGLVVNVLVFLQFVAELAGRLSFPPPLVALTVTVLLVSLVIAWFKDIPDMEGDEHFQVRTLTLRLGPHRVLLLGLGLLASAYLALIIVALIGLPGVHSGLLAGGHAIALLVLIVASSRVNPTKKPSMARFYLIVWGLFYAEYLMFPAAGILA